MCHTRTCLLEEAPGSMHCAVHTEGVLASEVKAENTCWRCKRKIGPNDFVSRTQRQDKHKKTGIVRFSWQHLWCVAPDRKPSKAKLRKEPKPLFDMLTDID
jgi:hypothetical protein